MEPMEPITIEQPAVAPTARRASWTSWVLAIACLVGGVAASLIAARAIAQHDADSARRAFHRGASTASSLALALGAEEQLAASAKALVAANPNVTTPQLRAWARRESALRRFPELSSVSFNSVAREQPLSGVARTAGAATTSAPAPPPPVNASPMNPLAWGSDAARVS
jgi:hypothetical protein